MTAAGWWARLVRIVADGKPADVIAAARLLLEADRFNYLVKRDGGQQGGGYQDQKRGRG